MAAPACWVAVLTACTKASTGSRPGPRARWWKRLLRMSAQLYNSVGDYERLAEGLVAELKREERRR